LKTAAFKRQMKAMYLGYHLQENQHL